MTAIHLLRNGIS